MTLKFPSFSSKHIYSKEIESITLIGDVHPKKWRWNPFNQSLDLKKLSKNTWGLKLNIEGKVDKLFSGAYSIRLVINHNFNRQLKVGSFSNKKWILKEEEMGMTLDNINFYSNKDQKIECIFNSDNYEFQLISADGELPDIQEVLDYKSYELNGFVWDSLNMFEKFNSKLPKRSFKKISDKLWSIEVPLKKNGGIDFRADGVYQFLISADEEENFGFSGLNDGKGTLVKGIGFSSSHGTSMHSAMTVKIFNDGIYKINLINPKSDKPSFSIENLDSSISSKPKILNHLKSYQLLGSIYKEDSFDPTKPNRNLTENNGDTYQIELDVESGDHSINFALSNELFLDTMALGCWLDLDTLSQGKTNKLSGIGWHGKPHEFNIPFSLEENTKLRFIYSKKNDNFSIEVIDGKNILKPTREINELSIVGDFEDPLEAWNTFSKKNLMTHIGKCQYVIRINLTFGKTYNYKYVGNRSNWALVFADYELDGNGKDFSGLNPTANSTSVKNLQKYGQLTSHGNPPALQYEAQNSGLHEFYADLITGAYSVKYLG
jgi:hypothetical protein